MIFNLPTLSTADRVKEEKESPRFDFEVGEFLFDRAGKPLTASAQEGYEQWCLKVCMTERNTRACYSEKIGVELEAIAQETSRPVAESKIIRTITEALKVHPRTQVVRNFSFRVDADNVWASFDVNSKNLQLQLGN